MSGQRAGWRATACSCDSHLRRCVKPCQRLRVTARHSQGRTAGHRLPGVVIVAFIAGQSPSRASAAAGPLRPSGGSPRLPSFTGGVRCPSRPTTPGPGARACC